MKDIQTVLQSFVFISYSTVHSKPARRIDGTTTHTECTVGAVINVIYRRRLMVAPAWTRFPGIMIRLYMPRSFQPENSSHRTPPDAKTQQFPVLESGQCRVCNDVITREANHPCLLVIHGSFTGTPSMRMFHYLLIEFFSCSCTFTILAWRNYRLRLETAPQHSTPPNTRRSTHTLTHLFQ